MMTAIEITPFHPSDQARWAELWGAYLAFYATSLPQDQFETTWARLLRDADLHGRAARRDGTMIGIVHYLFHPTAWASTPVCYLQDLYVEDAARGTGAGRALIEAVAEQARSVGAARLYWLTQDTNATARRLYEKLACHRGFIRYDYALPPTPLRRAERPPP